MYGQVRISTLKRRFYRCSFIMTQKSPSAMLLPRRHLLLAESEATAMPTWQHPHWLRPHGVLAPRLSLVFGLGLQPQRVPPGGERSPVRGRWSDAGDARARPDSPDTVRQEAIFARIINFLDQGTRDRALRRDTRRNRKTQVSHTRDRSRADERARSVARSAATVGSRAEPKTPLKVRERGSPSRA